MYKRPAANQITLIAMLLAIFSFILTSSYLTRLSGTSGKLIASEEKTAAQSNDKFALQHAVVDKAKKDLDKAAVQVISDAKTEDELNDEEILSLLLGVRLDLRSAYQDASYGTTQSWQNADKKLEFITKDLLAGIITPADAVTQASETIEKDIEYDS